ncbi:NAD(P)-binding protein [Lentinula aciculospora]|uniref:NAD(P)-binding protein n=1 Tax=Lentinula aciculospora TaxID=153920 RepID=A0A9W9A0G6_9AGAR|nr:NAD(P)-binding protein [Lentinula aciculospora]
MTQKLVLVTGATGRQGSSLINALKPSELEARPEDSEFHVLALTRNSKSPSARLLALQHHVTVIEGNLDSVTSIRGIFEEAKPKGGVWGVCCILAFPGLGANADGEEAQGKALADISLEYNVKSFIFSSVERGGERDDDKAVLDRLAKVKIERHVRELGKQGIPWTLMRPGFFMENYEGTIGKITVAVLKAGLRPMTTIQLITVDDIGYVAAGVLKSPQDFREQILCVVGECCTLKEQEESYKRATGRSLPAIPAFIARTLILINGHTKDLIADIERVHRIQEENEVPDHEVQVAAARRAYSNIRNFETWAKEKALPSSTRHTNGWNKVTISKLAAGRQ